MYELLNKQLASVLESETNLITNSSNFSAFIFNNIPNINWSGFYFQTSTHELLLGPFQGKPACVRIKIGNGVCGTAFQKNETILVNNVNEFEGHIACDSNSKSEIVIPLYKNQKLYGVFDIDSPIFNRFDNNDKKNLELLVNNFLNLTDFSKFNNYYPLLK